MITYVIVTDVNVMLWIYTYIYILYIYIYIYIYVYIYWFITHYIIYHYGEFICNDAMIKLFKKN